MSHKPAELRRRRKQELGHLVSRLDHRNPHDNIARVDHLDETTIALFIERRLGGDRVRDLQHHIDGCDECRQLVAELGRTSTRLATGSTLARPHSPAGRTHARGERIGRYVVLDLVGSGAMGAVYAAFDPDLDRKVAVKLLHSGAAASEAERTRLFREAQALARVTHPGVVAVHDVGTHGDQVFIAMEFVAGGTLKDWLRERERPWRAIHTVAVEAARGLAAAHAAGLVHRDVKPDNILVDTHGIARIGDFGLAAGVGEPPKRPSDPVVASTPSTFAADLTASGTIVGTPAYMAPEQFAGEPVTPRSDQFSFCATLYEALYGVRPYPGEDLRELASALAAGRIVEPATDRGVPSRVRVAITRGLAVDPEARHATMDELIAALTFDRWSRRRIVSLGLVGAAALGGLAFGVVAGRSDEPALCTNAGAELARVWNHERRAQVRDAILATKLPFAADSWARIERVLDGYARGWTAMHTETCEATAVHRTQSSELLDLRMSCLDHRRIDLDAAITTLAATDRESVRHAVRVTAGMPSLAVCADPDRMRATVPLPADPQLVGELDQIRREVARAATLVRAAAPTQALALATKAVSSAERAGYLPLQAAAYHALGTAQLAVGDPKGTRDSFERAVAAAASSGDEDLEARALGNLASLLRDVSPDGNVATEHARHALAIVLRSRRDPLLEAELRYVNLTVVAGLDTPAVLDHLARGRERLAAAAAAGADTLVLQLEYELIEAKLEVSAETALTKLARALLTAEQAYGATHPQFAAVLVSMAHYAVLAERPDEARRHARRAAELLAPYPGNEVELRRIDAALETDPAKRRAILDEVVRGSEKLYGPRSQQLASDRELLAETLLELELYPQGLVQIDAAIQIWEATYGGHYEKMITSLVTKAQLLAGLEDWEGVAAAAERANAIVDRGGMRELTKAMAKLLLVDTYFRQRRFAASLALLEEVTPLLKLALLGDPVAALLDFYAAACKWELGRDRPAELRKARVASATVRTSPAADAGSLEVMSSWLAGK